MKILESETETDLNEGAEDFARGGADLGVQVAHEGRDLRGQLQQQ